MPGFTILETTGNVAAVVKAWNGITTSLNNAAGGNDPQGNVGIAGNDFISAVTALSKSLAFAPLSKLTGFVSGSLSLKADIDGYAKAALRNNTDEKNQAFALIVSDVSGIASAVGTGIVALGEGLELGAGTVAAGAAIVDFAAPIAAAAALYTVSTGALNWFDDFNKGLNTAMHNGNVSPTDEIELNSSDPSGTVEFVMPDQGGTVTSTSLGGNAYQFVDKNSQGIQTGSALLAMNGTVESENINGQGIVSDVSGFQITLSKGANATINGSNTITVNAGATANLNSGDSNTLTNAVNGQTFTISGGSIRASGNSGPFGIGAEDSFAPNTDGSLNVAISDANGVLTDNDKFSSTGDFIQDQQYTDGVLATALNYTAGVETSEDLYDSTTGKESGQDIFNADRSQSDYRFSTDGSQSDTMFSASGVNTETIYDSTDGSSQAQYFTGLSSGISELIANYTAAAATGVETSQITDFTAGNSQQSFYTGLPTGESLETDAFSGTNATGTKTASLFNLTDGTSQEWAFAGLPSGESSIDSFFSGANGSGTKAEDLYDFTDGSSQTQSFTGLASGTSEVIESYTADNGTGTETSQITDFTAGNSQESIYTGLPTGESLETDAFSGTNATGTKTASLFDLTDGTSQDLTFTGLPSGESSVDSFFSGANGSGTKAEDLYDFTDGSSQTQSFTGLASGTSEVIESFSATNGTGTETSQITDFTAGDSQESMFTGLPSGELSETDAYTGTNATGTRTAALFDLTDGTSQEYSFAGLSSGVSSEDAFYSSANAGGTQTEDIYDLTDGSSQVQSFAGLASGVSNLTQNYTAADGTGKETSQVANLTDGTSQEVAYDDLPGGDSEVLQNYSNLNGSGALVLQYVDHTDGSSEVDQYSAGALTTADAFNVDQQLVLQNLYSGNSITQSNAFTPGEPDATTQTYFSSNGAENYQVSFDAGGNETQDDIFGGAPTETERLLFKSGDPYAADAQFFSGGNLTQDVSLNYAGQETESILYGPGEIETEDDLFNAGQPFAYQQSLFTGGAYASQVTTFNSTTGTETASAIFNSLTGSETGYSSGGGGTSDRSAADSSAYGQTVVVDYGDSYDGGYGYYGFAGSQSTINATLGSNIGSIAQADLNLGDTAGAAVAEAGLHDAQQAAHGNASGASGSTLEAAKWSGEQITWSLASAPATGGTPFSNYLANQYNAEVQQAFATWSATSGITFKEVADTSQSDIRVGWSNLNTSSTGTVGYTTFNAQSGNLDPGATIRLEDPSQDALVASASGQLTYAGTDATLEQVLLHEIGHTLGLADNSDPTSVMFYELNSANRTLDSTDIAGIQSLYGKNAPEPASASIDQLIQAMASYTPSSPGFTNLANIAPMKAQSLLLAAAH